MGDSHYVWPQLPSVRANPEMVTVDIESAIDRSPYLNTQQKRDMARIITREFLASDTPVAVAMAAVANAAGESGLNPIKPGDSGNSIGLFQLNMVRGAGKGMTKEQCQDPILNTRRIIEEYKAAINYTRQKDSKTGQYVTTESINQALVSGAPPSRLAALFALHVERPYDMPQAMSDRESLMRQIFPEYADLDSRYLVLGKPVALVPTLPEEGNEPSAFNWILPIGLGLVFATSAVLGAFWVKRQRARAQQRLR